MRKRPSPPPPTAAASTAVAMTCRTALRTPAATSGNASGSSTLRKTWPGVMPMPRAASTASRSTSRTPT